MSEHRGVARLSWTRTNGGERVSAAFIESLGLPLEVRAEVDDAERPIPGRYYGSIGELTDVFTEGIVPTIEEAELATEALVLAQLHQAAAQFGFAMVERG
ncbi:MAG TPA: hypothetical protein VGE07_00530 [Herpetosiphonaceae bacterium]